MLVAMAVLFALPMSSPSVDAARVLSQFTDGSDTMLIEFTHVPSPGERQTVYIKLKADVEVVSAGINMSSVIFEHGHEYTGQAGWVGLGHALDMSGDINGDGYDDLVLTVLSIGAYEGLVIGVWGAAGGILLPQDLTVQGSAADEVLGFSVSTGGDLNADGYDDVVMSAIQMDFGPPAAATGTGKVDIIWGGQFPNATADLTRRTGNDGDVFGWSVSTTGDVDGNGRDDMVVGAPRHLLNSNNPGRAYLYLSGYSGPGSTPNVTLNGLDNGDGFGYSVSICGDVNADGYDDVLVTAPGHNSTTSDDVGKAYLFLGKSTGVGTTADWTYTGSGEGDLLGYSAAGVGDVNGDGYDDIAVCAVNADPNGNTNAGEVHVFYGGSSGPSTSPDVTFEGDSAGLHLGASIASIGDSNNDGLGDFAIGVPDVDNGTTADTGGIWIKFGDAAGITAKPDMVKKGARANGDYGITVGRGGDANGDGYDDITVGDTTLLWTYINYGGGGVKSPVVYLDNTPIMSKTGMLFGNVASDDFAAVLRTYIASHLSEQDSEGYLTIPINITFASAGKLRLHDMRILFFKLNQPQGLKATPLARGNAVQLTWDAQIGDDTSAIALEMWNGTGWEELKKLPRLNTSHVVEGLVDGVEYEFRVRAYDGGVMRYSEPSLTVKVTPADTKAPAKVINVTAKENAVAKGINVTWDASDPDTVNYEVWSNKTGAWAVLANISAPDRWYMDTDIDDGPKYYYRIRAWDEVPLAGELSNIVFGILKDITPPAVPAGLAVVPLPEGNALRITWDLNTDDTVQYSLQSNKSGEWREVARLTRTVGQYIERGLMDGNTYWYRLYAIDESANPSAITAPVSSIPRDTTPPAAPQGVGAAPRSIGNTLRVEWSLNTDDTAWYKVYLYNTSSGAWQMVGMVPTPVTQYDAIGLVDGTSYRLRVTAIDDAGLESEASSEAIGIPRDTMFPTIPTGIKLAVMPEGGSINVSWSANYDDTVSYKIYRFEDGSWHLLGEVDATTTWFLDTGLTNNVRYPYVITAIDEVGNESPYSERKEAIPIDTVPPARPNFVELPSRTRLKDVTVSGVCEPFAKITLHVNKIALTPVDCDALGVFTMDVRLRSGTNEIYAVADDNSGYTTESDRLTVYVDETPPIILSIDPANGVQEIERDGLVIQIVFREDIVANKLEVVLVKGRQTNMGTLLSDILLGKNTVRCDLISYIRTDLRATFNVTETLDRSTTYTIVVMGVEDVAGNPMETEGGLGLWTSMFSTVGTGPVGPGDDGGDGGISNLVLGAVAAVIIIVVVIIVAIFIMRAGARGETVTVDRRVIQGPPPEPTAEDLRPDVQALYAEAYEERGDAPQEHHEVDAGLGSWLDEQNKASQQADEETKRLVAEMAKQPAPPADTGPIEELPPGLVEHHTTFEDEAGDAEGGSPSPKEDASKDEGKSG